MDDMVSHCRLRIARLNSSQIIFVLNAVSLRNYSSQVVYFPLNYYSHWFINFRNLRSLQWAKKKMIVKIPKKGGNGRSICLLPGIAKIIAKIILDQWTLQLACPALNVSDTKNWFHTFTVRVFIRSGTEGIKYEIGTNLEVPPPSLNLTHSMKNECM